MAVSGSMPNCSLASLLAGFLGGASGPAGTVLLMETSKESEWPARLALVSRIAAIGWVAGLALGVAWLVIGPGLLAAEISSMRALFVIGAALGLLSGLLAQVWTREPAVRVDRREVHVADVHARIERGRYLPIRILHFFNPLDWRKKVRLPRTLRIYLVCRLLLEKKKYLSGITTPSAAVMQDKLSCDRFQSLVADGAPGHPAPALLARQHSGMCPQA